MDGMQTPDGTFPPPEPSSEQPAPWKEIESGRYQPRRIRGSCLGRELG